MLAKGGRTRKVMADGTVRWTKKTKTTRKLRKPVAKAVTQVVKKVLNSKTETKYVASSPISGNGFENDIPSLGEWTVALPPMAQGPEVNERDGDKVNPVSHRTKLTVRIANTNTGTAEQPLYAANQTPLDITVYVFYGYIKSLKTYQGSTGTSGLSTVVSGSTEAAVAMNGLLDVGDGTYTTFDGSAYKAMLPLSELVNMKVKKFRLHKPAGWVNSGANAVDQTKVEQSSDGIHSRDLILHFKPPSKLFYKNSTDAYPDNYAPVFSIGYVYNDSISNPSQVQYTFGGVEYCAQNQLWYKDF